MSEQNDIVISNDKLGEFFMLDQEGEEQEYGTSGNYETAKKLSKEIFDRKVNVSIQAAMTR